MTASTQYEEPEEWVLFSIHYLATRSEANRVQHALQRSPEFRRYQLLLRIVDAYQIIDGRAASADFQQAIADLDDAELSAQTRAIEMIREQTGVDPLGRSSQARR